MKCAFFAEVHIAQEFNSGNNAFRIFVFKTEFSSALRSDCKVKGFKTLFAQIVERNVFSDFGIRFKNDAHFFKNVDFGFNDVFFQTERRNADGQHAARF